MKQVLILYPELAGYVVNCINLLGSKYKAKVHLIAYPPAAEAPFKFEFDENVKVTYRDQIDERGMQQLVDDNKPDLIYCAGWNDKAYLNIVRANKKTKSLLGFDNGWFCTLKQRLAVIYARLKFLPIFDYAFVPGDPQVEFAQKMGFGTNQIKTGAYTCDLDDFNRMYEDNKLARNGVVPRKMIYTGRYITRKGIFDMFEAFCHLVDEEKLDWELYCLGTGELWDQRKEHARIHHHGFVQPSEFSKFAAETSVLVLPSHFEPWGVVVHEFAAAGFPIIVSDQIGAASKFLAEGENGYSFEAGSKSDLIDKMRRIMTKNDAELTKMSEKSHEMGQLLSPNLWCETILEMS